MNEHANESAAVTPVAPDAARPARRASAFWAGLSVFAVLVLLGGLALHLYGPSGEVNQVMVTRVETITLPSLVGDSPDYYVVLRQRDGSTLATDAYKDRQIGNGLIWPLAEPIPFEDLTEIELFDKDLFNDDSLDRVNVTGAEMRGQKFTFTLAVSPPIETTIGYALIIAGGALLLIVVARFVYRQAV
jgi:hypothetical protein